VSGERAVYDTATGLMWQGCTAGLSGSACEFGAPLAYTWVNALSYCEGLSWGGQSDWRLPDDKELQSIVDHRRYDPAIDVVAFPSTPLYGWYWTSSSCSPAGASAWIVGFNKGSEGNDEKTAENDVRCVRDGL
jgi:hypothetical protein